MCCCCRWLCCHRRCGVVLSLSALFVCGCVVFGVVVGVIGGYDDVAVVVVGVSGVAVSDVVGVGIVGGVAVVGVVVDNGVVVDVVDVVVVVDCVGLCCCYWCCWCLYWC